MEHGNKDLKSVQIDHSRQRSYELRNLDTAHWLLDRSDPKVVDSCKSPAFTRSAEKYPPLVLSWCKDDQTGEIDAADFPGFFE